MSHYEHIRKLESIIHMHQKEISVLRDELERLNKQRNSEHIDHTYRLQDLRQQHQCELEEQKKEMRRSEERYRMQIKRYEAEMSELRRRLY